jgi:hypothetical protein
MTERFRFLDALTYGVRTLFWRPARAGAFIAMASGLSFAYYLWVRSGPGTAFMSQYMQSTMSMGHGGVGAQGGIVVLMMAGSFLYSCAVIAGAHRVYVRDAPLLSLPLRLGMDEFRTLGVYFVIWVLGAAIMLVSMIPITILIMIAGIIIASTTGADFAAMDESQSAAFGFLTVMCALIPTLLLYAYVAGRLAVSLPLTIRDRRFRLGGWAASKGAGMQLLFAHIILYLAMFAAVLAFRPELGPALIAVLSDPVSPENSARLTAIATDPYRGLAWLAIPVSILLTFMVFGPTAAVANWDARKRAAAAAPARPAAPAVEPANGTGAAD